MGISKQEVDCLVENKKREGKDFPEINREIKTLKTSQIVFKAQKTDLQKANDRIRVLERENSELKNKLLRQGLQLEAKKEERKKEVIEKREELKENGDEDYKLLKRLVLIISEEKGKKMTITDLKFGCCISTTKRLYPILKLLTDSGLIKVEVDYNGIERYWI